MKVPTKQLQELCNQYKCMPSTKDCLIWLFRQTDGYYIKTTISLHDFNKWIKKTRARGAYSPPALKSIREQLLALPIIKLYRQWRANTFELELIPYQAVKKTAIKLTKVKSNSQTSNRSNSYQSMVKQNLTAEKGSEQQQHINYQEVNAKKKLLTKSGFTFAPEVQFKLACKYSAKAIAASIEYVKGKMCGRRKVMNPEGYVIDALERGYWQDLSDRDTNQTFWEKIVANVRDASELIRNKIVEIKDTVKNSSEFESVKRMQEIYQALEPDYYEEEFLPILIAESKANQEAYQKRKKNKGFGSRSKKPKK